MLAQDLSAYRSSSRERDRTDDLLALMPAAGNAVLDVGARDGHLARLLTGRFKRVVALDISPLPALPDPIESVVGDVTGLSFPDKTFDLVVCAEVLEHIPPALLAKACSELTRVARSTVVIGVPFQQDLRLGKTTCRNCGAENPPWSHVNSFDEVSVARLFPEMSISKVSHVGVSTQRTNALSASLMRFAGNPFGTYDQEEPCIQCGSRLTSPGDRSASQRLATRVAHWLNRLQQRLGRARPNWMHVRLDKRPA